MTTLAVPTSAAQLPVVPGGWETKNVTLAGQTIRLTSPRDPDAFLDDPQVHTAHATSGYMPYWGYIWPAAWDMSSYILQQAWPKEIEVLEIGAGVGVAGLAGLAAGCRVTFADYDPNAIIACLFNARQNHWQDRAAGLVFDWGKPLPKQFPFVFGCDVIYELGNHEPILNLLDVMLTDDGECWLADPGRGRAPAFVMLACRRGYQLENVQLPRYPLPDRADGVTDLWIVKKGKRLRRGLSS